MPTAPTLRRTHCAGVVVVLGSLTALVLFSTRAGAEQRTVPPRLEIRGGAAGDREPFAPRSASSKRGGAKGPESSSAWWLGTGGIALALAACGGISVASKRFLPARGGPNTLRVLGRTSLSPKHSVYLLEVGQKILIVGTGAQGAPSLLGELTDPAEREAFLGAPRRGGPAVSIPPRSESTANRFDRLVGDEE